MTPVPVCRRRIDPVPVEPWFQHFPGVEGFLRAVAEEPWDETHRLILADWLEEQGATERADFIRLQCRAETLPHWLVPVHVSTRIRLLRTAHREAWWDGLPANLEAFGGLLCELTESDFTRVQATLEAVADVADVHRFNLRGGNSGRWADFSNNLTLWRDLSMLDLSSNSLGQLLGSLNHVHHLSSLGELRLASTGASDADLASLIGFFHTPELHTIDLTRNVFTPEAVRILAGRFHHLRRLRLDDNLGLGDEGLTNIALGGSAFAGLTRLEVSNTNIGRPGLQALASASLPELETFDLSENQLGAADVQVVAGMAGLPRLRHLDLSYNRLGDLGLAALASSPHLTGLTALNLRGCTIGSAGGRALARTDRLTRLTALALADNRLGTRGVQALAASPALASVQAIGLGGNKIGAAGARALARSKTLCNLWSLHLGENAVGDAGVRHLVESDNYRNLIALVLSNNALTEDAARAIAAAPGLARLGALTLNNNQIGSAGVRALVESPYLRHLFALNLHGNPITGDDAALLRARWPFVECRV